MMLRCLALCLVAGAVAAEAETLTLDDCIRRALGHNTQVRLAEQGLRRSAADVRSARANRLPNVNATLLNFTRSRTGPSVRIQENPTGEVDPVSGRRIFREETTQIPGINRNSFSLSASLSQTLYDGGNRRHAHHAARQQHSSTETALRAQRATTVFTVQQRYFELLKAQDLVEVQREPLKLSEKRVEEAKARLEVGVGVRADVLRLQVASGNAQADLINADQGVVLARANLNHIMGRAISEPLTPAPTAETDPAFDLGKTPLPALMERALANNPDIQRLQYAELASDHELSSSRAAWHPRLNGNLSYSRNNEVFDRVYQDLDQNYRMNASMTLTYNVFDGGLRSASIARSRIALENARMNLDEHRRQIALFVETAKLELERLDKITEINARTVELAQEDLRLGEESYRIGRGTLLELLDAQVSFTQARSTQVRTRRDLAVARADLERLVGVTSY